MSDFDTPLKRMLPVYIPSNVVERREVIGEATIDKTGVISIVLHDPVAAKHVVALFEEDRMLALAFDYLAVIPAGKDLTNG
jgi:hypothetical protein